MVHGMKQQTFSDIEYSNRRKKTKREEFLDSIGLLSGHYQPSLPIREKRTSSKRH